MAGNPRHSGVLGRRLIGVLLALALLAAVAPSAGAISQSDVDKAKARVEALKGQVAVANAQLSALEAKAAVLAEQVFAATDKLKAIEQELRQTQAHLEAARERHDAIQARLDERAREAYMNGPGGGLEFLLGSTSLTDLSDRLEYVDAVSQSDADLANEVQNLANDLAAQEKRQAELEAEQARVVNELHAKEAELNDQVDLAQSLVAQIAAKQRKAEAYAAKVSKEYQRQLAQQFGVHFSDGVFQVCPVDQPRIVTDSFGAPRYAGGYHPHAGNDIMAPQGTPIRAPFAGNAVSANNGLGGLAVIVYGSDGYVYNAHLSSLGQLGNVSAGTVIGYVGSTGDAAGGPAHDHFEWHPNVVPSSWPKSSYGYSVIGDAVNPYPLLAAAC